jgi:hypothetical protein
MRPAIAFRCRFPLMVVDHAAVAAVVGEILTRPCFGALERVAGKQGDKLVARVPVTRDAIAAYLRDRTFEGVQLDNGGREVIASAELPNGEHVRSWPESPVRLYGYAWVPVASTSLEDFVGAACDLAKALDARSGAIAVEPDYQLAQRWGLEMRPRSRPGLPERRMSERGTQRTNEDQLATKIAGPEWGTLLGPGHLERIDREQLKAAAARVVEITASLVLVQATLDPLDDLSDGFDAKLDPLRRALAPVLGGVDDRSRSGR